MTSSPAESLVVGVRIPYKQPADRSFALDCLRDFLRQLSPLAGSGLTIKVESIAKILWASAIREIQEAGFKVFLDLKLFGNPDTLAQDALALNNFKPDIVTVCAHSGLGAMEALKDNLHHAEVLGVTVLSSSRIREVKTTYGMERDELAYRLARNAKKVGLDGIVCPPFLLRRLDQEFIHGDSTFTLNTPNVTTSGIFVSGREDQDLVDCIDVKEAIRLGATRVIVERAISTGTHPSIPSPDPLRMTNLFLSEIASTR